MAVNNVRSVSKFGYTVGVKTSTIWRCDVGTGLVNSNDELPAGNNGALVLGKALRSHGNRDTRRTPVQANNARARNLV